MRFDRGIDPATSDFLTAIMEGAWAEAHALAALRSDAAGTHAAMVRAIVRAVDDGERNALQLKKLALAVARMRQMPQAITGTNQTSLGALLRHYTKRVTLMVKFTP
jgi:hypothetical protein